MTGEPVAPDTPAVSAEPGQATVSPPEQTPGPPEPPSTSSKIDPATLVLRGSPGRVTRFRRGAVIGIAAAGSTAIIMVAWMALRPVSLKLVASPGDRPPAAAAAPPEIFANVPRSYGDVPPLGPPLPGDLGRPILNRQRELGVADSADPMAEAARKRLQEAEAERQRRAAEQRSARESPILMPLGNASRNSQETRRVDDPAISDREMATSLLAARGGTDAEPSPEFRRDNDPNGQSRKQMLVGKRADGANGNDINPHGLQEPVSPYTLMAGSVIAASLITGLNSDLPGFVTAQVTENVYDSVTGHILLLPQGARLIGSYDSVVAFGQRRALLVWQRIILPDGSSIRIDNVPATDIQGYAGLADRIDRHSWQLLKGVVLSTLLGVGTELSLGSDESDLVQAIRESAQQSGARAGDQLVMRSLDIQPTLRVRPGWPLRVVVHKDIVLRPWRRGVR